jgi:hypothetical protein
MDEPIDQKKCDNHKEINIEFYCFDDNSFLCSKCFKDHKKHNIEIIDDLKEKDKIYKSLLASKLNFTEYYTKVKSILEKVQQNIQKTIQLISKKLEELKNSAPPNESKSIFSLSFIEYEHIGFITDLNSKIKSMSTKLDEASRILKRQKEYVNFRAISKEVQVLEKSKTLPDFPIDIIFERDNRQEYTLFEGAKGHFMILDFGKVYFLKNIQIGITQHDCSLKEFFLLIKNKNGEWENTGKYVCKPFNDKMGLQVFNVGKEAQIIKLELINTWGIKSGNYILIKKIFFEIADIV